MEGSFNQVRGASKDRIGLQHQRKTLHGCSKVLQKLFTFPIILFPKGEPAQADLGKSDGEERVVPGERGTLPALPV